MSEYYFKVARLCENAIVPKRADDGAAGYDIYASEKAVVFVGGSTVVKTGISISVSPKTYARIAPRSGLAAKNSIGVGAGVVDSSYRGEVGVVLFNHGSTAYIVNPGDRIAQIVLEKIVTPEIEVVDLSVPGSDEDADPLGKTSRGTGGFGSSGV